ncbi:MAG: HEAT repeat domain-containing protein [Methylococcaceae bacterium]|nr:HEAT repeat domain-containing protein [Methylococcaceae bacterium]
MNNNTRSLFELLSDPSESNRVAALIALADIKARVSLTPIHAALNDPDKNVKAAAAFALSKIGNRKSLEYLLSAWKATSFQDIHLRRQLMVAIGEIGEGAALVKLLDSFAEWDYTLQELMIGFLSEKGEQNGSIILRQLLKQKLEPQIIAIINKALQKIGSR